MSATAAVLRSHLIRNSFSDSAVLIHQDHRGKPEPIPADFGREATALSPLFLYFMLRKHSHTRSHNLEYNQHHPFNLQQALISLKTFVTTEYWKSKRIHAWQKKGGKQDHSTNPGASKTLKAYCDSDKNKTSLKTFPPIVYCFLCDSHLLPPWPCSQPTQPPK